MAAPQAPMPLARQVAEGGTLTITMTMQGMSGAPYFTKGGTTHNSGNPTATFTGTVAQGTLDRLIGAIDEAWRSGHLKVS